MNSDLNDRVALLERQVTQLSDEKAIRELVLQYSFNADLALFQEFVDLFTEDAVIDVEVSEFVPVPPKKDELFFQGHDDIMRFITGAPHRAMLDNGCQHHTSGQLSLSINGDEADGFGYSYVVIRRDAGFTFGSVVFRRWHFRRVNDTWRIAGVKMRPTDASNLRELRSEPW